MHMGNLLTVLKSKQFNGSKNIFVNFHTGFIMRKNEKETKNICDVSQRYLGVSKLSTHFAGSRLR